MYWGVAGRSALYLETVENALLLGDMRAVGLGVIIAVRMSGSLVTGIVSKCVPAAASAQAGIHVLTSERLFRSHSYVERMPVVSSVRGVQPSAVRRLVSSSFRGVPSGFEES